MEDLSQPMIDFVASFGEHDYLTPSNCKQGHTQLGSRRVILFHDTTCQSSSPLDL